MVKMTNAEKYLKDGMLLAEFITEFGDYCSRQNYNEASQIRLEKFLYKRVKPQLTEDERVILKNINKNFTHIYRLNNRLQVADGEENYNNTILDITAFGHLFQFIKERRRI